MIILLEGENPASFNQKNVLQFPSSHLEQSTVLYIQVPHPPPLLIPVFLFVFQIIMVTKYWTKHNIAAVCISVVLMFICMRITHNARLFERSPADYIFIGTLRYAHLSAGLLFIYFCLSNDVAPHSVIIPLLQELQIQIYVA